MIFTIVFIAICLGFVAIALAYFVSLPFVSSIGPDSNALGYLGAMAGIFTIGIPMLALTLFLARKFTPFNVKYRLNGNLFIPWLISLGLFASAGFKTIKDYQAHASATYTETYELNRNKPLKLNFTELGYEHYMDFISLGHLKYYDKKPYSENVKTMLIPSKNKEFIVETEIESRGSSKAKANQYIKRVKPELSFSNNTLSMAQLFEIGNNTKYRGQEVLHKIYVPIGTQVEWKYWPQQFKYNTFSEKVDWHQRRTTDIWEMTKDGLTPVK